MSINRIALTVPAALGAVLMFAGCTSAPTPDPAPSTGESPLTAYMTAIYGVSLDPNQSSAELSERQKKSETLVAACMKEKGFDYTPVANSFGPAGGEYKPDDRDWVAQNGYGLTRTQDSDAPTDPNMAYMDSLSESERGAYLEALWGTYSTEGPSDKFDPTKAGCQGAAMAESGALSPIDSDEFADLRTSLQDLYANIGALPDQQKADSDWASCMADAGYPDLKTQSDGLISASDHINSATTDGSGSMDQAKVDELRKLEIDTALADLDCRTKTDYDERSKQARWAAEEKFVAEHKSELDAAKAAAEQARS